ncbi:3-dehydroquinate synthase [Aestuariivirga litoralis]|uniref:3-dehydroquinate synthase n=1 Tax=Aestuariivirga litoralis TaxID=2650924 RepID=UPI0018C55440|nr:3-dehydroquinate synthase [Aestuariivirga litoralis]MBG1233360.1 3-dehydroquinate synthase [Aestuariivirga litoralis]
MTIDHVHVDLAGRSYDIKIGQGLLAQAATHIQPLLKRKFAAIVTDENVAKAHLKTLEAALKSAGIESKSLVLPPGESTKAYAHLAETCDGLLGFGVERKDAVIALGGGVIGDLTGFAAAILRRGVNFIQIPTSLLAQVDSSVGGKTGINSRHGKNLVGAFHQPILVLADLDVLGTLPQRQRAAGYAEVAKYGLLGNAPFFEWLEQNVEAIMEGDIKATAQAVKISCEMKARIVTEDETETGVRALLNLGHTFGHALEAAMGYSDQLLHGEAVAIGMVQAFGFSEKLGHCQQGLNRKVAAHLKRAGLPTHMSEIKAKLPEPEALVKLMYQDKKAEGGRLTFILAEAIGKTFIAKGIDEAKVLGFLKEDAAKQGLAKP